MASNDLFLKFDFDDSVLNNRLTETDETLKKHYEMILELQNRLNDMPNNRELQQMREEMNKEYERKFNDLNSKYQSLQSQYNSALEKIQKLNEKIESQSNELTQYVDARSQKTYDDLMTSNSNEQGLLNLLEDRVTKCENSVSDQKNELSDYHTHIQHVASSIANFNDSDVLLDKNMYPTLKESVNFVKTNIQKLYDEISLLKNQSNYPTTTINSSRSQIPQQPSQILSQQSQLCNQPQQQQQRPQIVSPKVSKGGVSSKPSLQPLNIPNNAEDLQDVGNESIITPTTNNTTIIDNQSERRSSRNIVNSPYSTPRSPKIAPNSSMINMSNSSTSFKNVPQSPGGSQMYDLSSLRPYPAVQVHWRDHPNLPDPRPFVTIEEVVDYIYQVYPYLQAYMNAMHQRLVETTDQLPLKVDRDLVERMFERMQTIIGDIRQALNNMKKSIEKTATRNEINGLIDDMLTTMRQEAQTAVGRVRCIACGRESSQITGAMTEEEINRAFGASLPTSVLRGGTVHNPGQMFNSKNGYDSAIIESPRSKRPLQNESKNEAAQQQLLRTKAKYQ